MAPRPVPALLPIRERALDTGDTGKPTVVGAAPSASSLAPAEPEDRGPFYRWLVVPGRIEVFSGHDRLLVIPETENRFAVAPGYVLTRDAIKEEPLLLAGVPPYGGEPLSQRPQGSLLSGRVEIRGDWPAKALAVLDEMPQGGCAGCIEEYSWEGDHWRHLGSPDERPSWWRRGDGDPNAPQAFRGAAVDCA